MASQIVFKEKDYNFLYKARLVPMTQTTDNPLRGDRPKVQVQRGRKQNIKIRTKGNFLDPLSRAEASIPKSNDPLARAGNPLNRPQTVDPLARTKQQKTFFPQQAQQAPSKSVEPKQIVEIEQEEKKIKNIDFSIIWSDIRDDFMRIFKVDEYNLEQPVSNPFGNQVQSMNVYDGQVKSAYSGDNKIEYDRQNQRQQPTKQILQRIYIQKVIDIRKDLRKNWLNGDKVASLQLAIQACKLLIDNEKAQFAPIKYIYVIDILENFGKFVIDRLLKLSYPQYSDQKISEISLQSIIGSNISETASEIGRNWLIKIGSIRELLPRLYVEATLLKVLFFIDSSQIKIIFQRLLKQVRAIGDYINAMYFALYMFRIGAELFSGEKDYLISTLKDFFIYMNQKGRFSTPDLTPDQYMQLFEPYLIQTFRQYSQNCTERQFKDIFEHFRQSNQNHFVLRKIVDEFQSIHICSMALELFSIMQAYPVQIKYQLYGSFLPKIAKGLTNKAAGVEICQLVLQDIMQIKSFTLFLDILASLIELIFRSFTGYQKNQFFFQILQRFNELFSQVEKDQMNAQQNKETFIKLHQFVIKIFSEAEDISEVLQIDTFITCVQFFPEEMKKIVCWDLLNMIVNRDQKELITDPIAVNSVLKLAININIKKRINKDEANNLAIILGKLLYRFDFNRDLEQTLNLYAEIRANFGNISRVSEILINRTIELIFRAKKYKKGKNSKLVVHFIQACIAYCYITIPTIENPFIKLKSYLQVAEIGLSLNLISQTESIIKTTIETLLELPEQIDGKYTDEQLLPFLEDFISFLIMFPDDPAAGYMNLFSGLLKVLEQVQWNKKNGEINKLYIYINCIQYLCSSVQEQLPYHFENVKSNDSLFNKDPQYSLTILDLVQQLYKQIGEFASNISKLQINDQTDNGYIVKALLHVINRILLIIKFTKGSEGYLQMVIDTLIKKLNDLNRDRSGKVQIGLLKSYVLSTIFNIEKLCQLDVENVKTTITKILEQR